jgi:hypothetical protein
MVVDSRSRTGYRHAGQPRSGPRLHSVPTAYAPQVQWVQGQSPPQAPTQRVTHVVIVCMIVVFAAIGIDLNFQD